MRSKERNGFFPLRRGRLVKLLRRTQGPGASTGMRIGGNYSKVGGERSGRAGRKSSAWPSQTPSPAWHSGRRNGCRRQGTCSRRSRPSRYSPCPTCTARRTGSGARPSEAPSARPCRYGSHACPSRGCTDRTRGSRHWRSHCCSRRACCTCWSTASAPAPAWTPESRSVFGPRAARGPCPQVSRGRMRLVFRAR